MLTHAALLSSQPSLVSVLAPSGVTSPLLMERGNEDAATKTPAGPAGWGGRICLLLLVALLIGAIAWNFDDLNALLKKFAAWANRDIVAGALVFIAIYGVGTVLFFPMSILTIAAGFVWGWLAVPLVIAGASVGMSLSFLVARYLLYPCASGSIFHLGRPNGTIV